MKIAINCCFGGWDLKDAAWAAYEDYKLRAANELISYIEEHEAELDKIQYDHSRIRVVTIPDDATDWLITDDDGMETLYYVVDGKIHCVN